MEYVILGLLMIKSMTIYEMNSSFKKGISLFYSASYGSLQRAVKKLLEGKFITYHETVTNGRNRKVYSVLDSGKERFYTWMMEDIQKNKVETIMLAKLFFMGLINDKQDRVSIIKKSIEAIEEYGKDLKQVEKDVEDIKVSNEYDDIAKYQIKTLEYGLDSYRHSVKWYEKLLNEMNKEIEKI